MFTLEISLSNFLAFDLVAVNLSVTGVESSVTGNRGTVKQGKQHVVWILLCFDKSRKKDQLHGMA